ncbi:MAG: DUF4870 domain-containing protein [Myxococcaceae bacterium]|jgi:uncharacterized membrane protein|nr:DUF4870 domain-containing protein [Myxococcaceae bacterium]MCA3015379.1 DUF4870 domain-containing protein [Myxococcaceae bacterium]
MTPQDQQQSPIQSAVSREMVKEENKIHLFLAYLGNVFGLPLCLIPLLTVKDDEFIKWNAKQALVLFGVTMVLSMVSGALIAVLIGLCLLPAVLIGALVANLVALVKSLNGERWRIPVVADLADKF